MDLPVQVNNHNLFDTLLSLVKHTKNELGASAASLVIIQDDQIVTEWYDGFHHFKNVALQVTADSLFNVYSTRKTYVGLATALAMVEGQIPINIPIHKLINEIPKHYLGDTTLRDLITKKGLKYFGPNKIEREEMACKVIERVTGYNIAQLITEKVLEPLGLTKTKWITAPQENLVCDFFAGYPSVRIESNEGHERNLYTSARDLAYWCYLFLKKGEIFDHRFIPNEVFDLIQKLSSEEEYDTRVFGWYFQKHYYYATGAAGVHCVVVPEHNTVAVRMLNKYTDQYIEDQISFNSTLLDCLTVNVQQL